MTPPASRLTDLRRSLTPSPGNLTHSSVTQPASQPRLYKSRSAIGLEGTGGMMTAVAHTSPSLFAARDEQVMDTRTPSPLHRLPSNASSAEEYKPDLSAEVAMLSTKLVNAINFQTNLDDSLQQARHDLDQARQELNAVRGQKKQMDDMIQGGVLVRASDYEKRMADIRAQLVLERVARESAEKAKKQTDAELETLTVSLFEEANTMVAAARRETESAERRNVQLRQELADTELLLAGQQEQLQELKASLEKLERATEHDSVGTRENSIPSTPIHSGIAAFDSLNFSSSPSGIVDIPPDHPLHFSHLLYPVMRNDINAYADFVELMSIARLYRVQPHSRSGSNHTAMSSSSQTHLPATVTSSPNLPGAFSFATSSPQSSFSQPTGPALKESKFYKRSLVEDLEPTLRLDLAPGLSFISRRTVMSALLQGNLVVEPFAQHGKSQGAPLACALCGESRREEPYLRKHRLRTSEDESAQRYPLCDYCLNRVRAAGDFVGFLRIVRDGHWRCDSEVEQKSAWDESVRLRERMFWARLGGGVVPALSAMRKDMASVTSTAARPSLEDVPETRLDASSLRSPSVVSVASDKTSLSQKTSLSIPEATRHISGGGDPNRLSKSNAPQTPPSLVRQESSTVFEDAKENISAPDRDSETRAVTDTIVEAPQESISTQSTSPSAMLHKEQSPPDLNGESSKPVDSVRTPSPPGIQTRKSPSSSPSRRTVRQRSPDAVTSSSGQASGVLARVRAMEAKAQSQNKSVVERKSSNGSLR